MLGGSLWRGEGGGTWSSTEETASVSETRSGIADMVELPAPPARQDVRRDVIKRLRALRASNEWQRDPSCFRQRFGFVLIDHTKASARADAEFQRRLRVYELLRTNWRRLMLCLQCGNIYDPYLYDELVAEGRRLYEAGERRTGSQHLDETLADYEERVQNVEARLIRGDDPGDATAVMQRLSAAIPLGELGPAIRGGVVSPVVHARVFNLANRLLVAMFEGYARRYRESAAVVVSAVEAALMDEVSRAPLLLKLDAADSMVEQALCKARRDFDALNLIEQVDIDLSAFDRASRIIDELILVGPVAVKYRALAGTKKIGHETHH
ncbi:hypothetical protein K2Z84_10480 [Candidatus Binatia bacterium]|nr:hypothetical protein [Candidatus Binatia bacterium]